MVALRSSVFVSESNKYNHIRGFLLNKNWLTLTFNSQYYLKCSGGYVSYH